MKRRLNLDYQFLVNQKKKRPKNIQTTMEILNYSQRKTIMKFAIRITILITFTWILKALRTMSPPFTILPPLRNAGTMKMAMCGLLTTMATPGITLMMSTLTSSPALIELLIGLTPLLSSSILST